MWMPGFKVLKRERRDALNQLGRAERLRAVLGRDLAGRRPGVVPLSVATTLATLPCLTGQSSGPWPSSWRSACRP